MWERPFPFPCGRWWSFRDTARRAPIRPLLETNNQADRILDDLCKVLIMDRKSLESSNIASAGYDDQTHTLEIEFLRGGIYQYFDVPRPIFEQLVGTESPGSVLHQQIRGVFRYARI